MFGMCLLMLAILHAGWGYRLILYNNLNRYRLILYNNLNFYRLILTSLILTFFSHYWTTSQPITIVDLIILMLCPELYRVHMCYSYVAQMVLTSAEDGSVRVFHAGLGIHPYLSEANTFDRMSSPIHQISSTSQCSASLSTEAE